MPDMPAEPMPAELLADHAASPEARAVMADNLRDWTQREDSSSPPPLRLTEPLRARKQGIGPPTTARVRPSVHALMTTSPAAIAVLMRENAYGPHLAARALRDRATAHGARMEELAATIVRIAREL